MSASLFTQTPAGPDQRIGIAQPVHANIRHTKRLSPCHGRHEDKVNTKAHRYYLVHITEKLAYIAWMAWRGRLQLPQSASIGLAVGPNNVLALFNVAAAYWLARIEILSPVRRANGGYSLAWLRIPTRVPCHANPWRSTSRKTLGNVDR